MQWCPKEVVVIITRRVYESEIGYAVCYWGIVQIWVWTKSSASEKFWGLDPAVTVQAEDSFPRQQAGGYAVPCVQP